MSPSAPNPWLSDTWPPDLDPHTVCLSVDVEWAAQEVLNDLRRLFDERGLPATFFCTHAGIEVGNHERGLHPNYRPTGDTLRELRTRNGDAVLLDDVTVFRHVLQTTRSFAPEAKGVRSHSLHYDSQMLPFYSEIGLEYDSTYLMPLVSGLRPFWKEYGVLELPIYFNDHFELKTGATRFDIEGMGLDRPGLKVINMHPNMVFLNAPSNEVYLTTRSFYHDVERLLGARHPGRGIRTMIIELLNALASKNYPVMTLGEINLRCRSRLTSEVRETLWPGNQSVNNGFSR